MSSEPASSTSYTVEAIIIIHKKTIDPSVGASPRNKSSIRPNTLLFGEPTSVLTEHV